MIDTWSPGGGSRPSPVLAYVGLVAAKQSFATWGRLLVLQPEPCVWAMATNENILRDVP